MKKKRILYLIGTKCKILTLFKAIKIFTLLFLIFLSNLSVGASAQDIYVNLQLRDATIETIVKELEKQLRQDFFFSKNEIDISKKIDINLSNASLEDAVKVIFGDGFKHRIVDNLIVISPKEAIQETQAKSISGRVIDDNNHPLPGVTVILKGTTLGVATDVDGRFTMYVPQDTATLIFTFIGMETQEVKIRKDTNGEFSNINVILKEDKIALEDVVITGYANIRKESFTGSSTKVTGEELKTISTGNLIKTLEVFDPSFKLVQNDVMGADPNTMPDYYIRGHTGTSQVKDIDRLDADDVSQFALTNNPSAPIFILDGFEVSQTKIYDLDINRINSVTILKDAAATAFYGSRAANGVIVIETISPQPGVIRANYNTTVEIAIPDLTSYDLLNARENLEAEYAAGLYYNENQKGILWGMKNYEDKLNVIRRGVNTDWKSKPLRTELNHKHSILLNGGSQELRWSLDFNFHHNGGVMKKSYRNVYGVSLNLEYVLSKIQIRNQAGVSFMNNQNSPYGSFGDYIIMKPYLEPYDENGKLIKKFAMPTTGDPNSIYVTTINNPLYEASLKSYDRSEYKEFYDNFIIRWAINDFFLLKGQYSISFQLQDSKKFKDPASEDFSGVESILQGELNTNEFRYSSWKVDIGLSYLRSINLHNINFYLSGEANEKDNEAFYFNYQGFNSGDNSSVAHANTIKTKPTYQDSKTRSFGAFLLTNYSYNDIYLFDLSARLDGSSAFGTEKKIGEFWSLGTGINFHNYGFLSTTDWLNQFKITATYGTTGKANFNPYQARTTYQMNYEQEYSGNKGMSLKALGNEKLKWEKSKKWNFLTQFGLLNRRLNIEFEYYRDKTFDMVESVSLRSSSGFNSYTGNIGQVLNKGYEFKINVIPYRNQDWEVSFYINGNHNTNKLVKLADALKEYNQRVDEYYSNSSNIGGLGNNSGSIPILKYEEGSSLTAIYGMKSLGIDPASGAERYLKRDGTFTDTWSSPEQQKIGDTESKLSGSIRLNLRWRSLSLYSSFLYYWGGDQYNTTYPAIENVNLLTQSGDKRILTQRWQKYGDVTKLRNIGHAGAAVKSTSRFVQKNNTLKFNSLTVSYDFNKELVKRIGLSGARVQFMMNDIATISTIKQERGTTYPYAHTFNLNFNLNF